MLCDVLMCPSPIIESRISLSALSVDCDMSSLTTTVVAIDELAGIVDEG